MSLRWKRVFLKLVKRLPTFYPTVYCVGVHNILRRRRRRELASAEQQRELDDGWVFSQNADGGVFAVGTEFISPN
jgi:hypothetical protein